MRRLSLSPSLRLRLALWYGGLTLVVVALVCLYSFAVHSRVHYEEIDVNLSFVAEHVAAEIQRARSNEERARVVEASSHLGTNIRIYDSAGTLALQSSVDSSAPTLNPEMFGAAESKAAYPAIAALAPAMPHGPEGHGRFDVMSREGRWRVHVLDIEDTNLSLAAMVPLAHIDASVRRFAWLMALMAITGGTAAFTVGLLISRRALRPVSTLTRAAADIARTQEFSRRVEVSAHQDELGTLGNTFNEMLGNLEQAYTAQRRFVSDASHELRTPLTVIQANLDIASHHFRATDEANEAIQEAYRETTRLSRLVSDLLALARADAGISVQKHPVEFDRVVLDIVDEARHLTNGQNLRVEPVVPCLVTGDPDRLRQLVLNLIANAVKYTRAGDTISVSVVKSKQTVVFKVEDSGIGIAADEIPRIFERFYRTESARSSNPSGTGLGLAIVRWIVDQHNGTIAVKSQQHSGTTITVQLPASP